MMNSQNSIPPLQREFLSIRDACAVAACGRTTLYAAAVNGEIQFTKRGRKTLVPVVELKQWMAGPEAATAA